ncbi:hypothetical protein ACFLQI_00695 [Candidatus Undinarchaeota archaeon]
MTTIYFTDISPMASTEEKLKELKNNVNYFCFKIDFPNNAKSDVLTALKKADIGEKTNDTGEVTSKILPGFQSDNAGILVGCRGKSLHEFYFKLKKDGYLLYNGGRQFSKD